MDSHAASAIRGEVQLISPAGSWEFVPGVDDRIRRRGRGPSGAAASPSPRPATARPGQRWWVIAKVMYFGRVRYSEAAEVVVS